MSIGRVFASHVDDPACLDFIKQGHIDGEALLGELVAAIHELVVASVGLGYHGSGTAGWLGYLDKSEAAWVKLFGLLKQIEQA